MTCILEFGFVAAIFLAIANWFVSLF